MIRNLDDLDALLRPAALHDRETIRFPLAGFRSRVTRELLQVRMRRQADMFGTGATIVAANVVADGEALEVDAEALLATNATVTARLDGGAEGSIAFLRLFARTERVLAGAATAFERALRTGRPSRGVFLTYLDANTAWQELGALKFCLPTDLASRVAAVAPGHHEALLGSWMPSPWTRMRLAQLALARVRLRSPAARYPHALSGYRRVYGYLGAEDVDFEDGERAEAIEAGLACLAEEAAIAAAVATLVRARAADQGRRRAAAAAFAEAAPDAAMVGLVLLARTLARHEDLNRRAKMRLLRNLRDLAAGARLEIAYCSLRDLAVACEDGRETAAWESAQTC